MLSWLFSEALKPYTISQSREVVIRPEGKAPDESWRLHPAWWFVTAFVLVYIFTWVMMTIGFNPPVCK